MTKRKRLGELLISRGVITGEQLRDALIKQKTLRIRIGEILVSDGLATEADILQALSEQLGIPYIADARNYGVDFKLASQTPLELLRTNHFIPAGLDKTKGLTVLCNDPYNGNIEQICAKTYKAKLNLVLAKNSDIAELLSDYEQAKNHKDNLSEIKGGIMSKSRIYDLDAKDDSPVVTIVNGILSKALRMRASDVHFKHGETLAELEYRIDGILRLIDTYPLDKSAPLFARLKSMAGVSSTEKRRPQDGSFTAVADGFGFDARLSSMPSVYGESIVVRLLDRRFIEKLTIDDLGFTQHNKARFLSLLSNPNGIVAVTGPTGSGKTSTNYVALKRLITGKSSVYSVEDPVEYKIKGVVPTQINEKAGITFANVLRSIVRQDPDIIFVGEIRDEETAAIAMNAADLGKFILTTLHTNDSVSAVSRMMNLGVRPYQIENALLGATAQVLARKICPNCGGGNGCEMCDGTGYYGRHPLQEVFVVSDRIREHLVSRDLNITALRKTARAEGLVTMYEDGLEKVKQGITTLEEVERVTRKAGVGVFMDED